MRRAALLLAMVGAVLLAFSGVVLAQQSTTPTEEPTTSARGQEPAEGKGRPIPGQYIVVLKDREAPNQVAEQHRRQHGAQPGFVYENAIKGYSAEMSERAAAAIQNDPRVAYVEQDQEMEAFEQSIPWGINKIDADTSSTRAGDGSGSVTGVKTYVIDTGIETHGDLNTAEGHQNFTGDGKNYDCNGHGTHVAGTVAAKDDTSYVVGGTPDVSLVGVKVLGCDGGGTNSGVIKGVDWVTANAAKPAVANMSLGGGASQALDDAVKRSANSGVFYSIAAGNSGANACNYSPARVGKGTNGIVTTAAIDNSDKEASFSNYGSCVDIWAPGVSIPSTYIGGGTKTLSGTSMAAPHVGGTGALYLSNSTNATKTPTETETQLKADSVSTGTKGKGGYRIKRVNAAKY